jgi:hypothetical protein
MLLNKLLATSLLLLATACLSAGRYAGDFMMIGSGVRPLGMGGAYAAIANDGNAIYWNSSGIAQIRETDITVMRAFLYKGLAAYDNISICQPLPNEVTIGLNLTRLTIDNIPKFNESYLILHSNVDERINNSLYHLPGIPDGTIKSTDDLFQFAFSKHFHYDINMGWLYFTVPLDSYIGANVKYIKRSVGDKIGTGTGFDLSVLLKTDLAVLLDVDGLGNLIFGSNLQDVSGTEITWGVTENFHKDEILFNTKVGFAVDQPFKSLNSTLTLAYDRDYVYGRVYHVGLDWNYDSRANLRLGYFDGEYSAGASVKVYGVWIDYAAITNTLGLSNRIGLRLNF